MLNLLGCLLVVGAWSGDTVRRLSVEGEIVHQIDEFPFVVALLNCPDGDDCSFFCSGSLVSPEIVLTAAHCFLDGSRVNKNYIEPRFAMEDVVIKLGSKYGNATIEDDVVATRSIKAASFHHFGKNLRHTYDDDLVLVILSEPVEIVPGRIETIKLASDDATSIVEGCSTVTTVGYGTSAKLPRLLSRSDGQLRVIRDSIVHTHRTCKAHSGVARNKAFCFGGNRTSKPCSGDSGGPVVVYDASGEPVLVGVVSFGDTTCALGPDYATRASTYVPWLMLKIEKARELDFLSTDQTVQIFPAGPIAEDSMPESSPEADGRCAEWQCRSGECILKENVCDGLHHCKDGSDEDQGYCSETPNWPFHAFPFPKVSPRSSNIEQSLTLDSCIALTSLYTADFDKCNTYFPPTIPREIEGNEEGFLDSTTEACQELIQCQSLADPSDLSNFLIRGHSCVNSFHEEMDQRSVSDLVKVIDTMHLCGYLLPYYRSRNARRTEYAENFLSLYQEPTCPAESTTTTDSWVTSI